MVECHSQKNKMDLSVMFFAIHNATMRIVNSLENQGRSESEATVEVGIFLGVVLSVIIFALSSCVAFTFCSRTRRSQGTSVCCKSSPTPVLEAVEDDAAFSSTSPVAQIGAYRSESDTDDEGQSKKVAAVAQKRARHTPGV